MTKLSQETGVNLDTRGFSALPHAYAQVPYVDQHMMDFVSIEAAHDELLGNWPQQVYCNCFFYCRDTKNPNYFGLEALKARYDEYDFKGMSRWASAIVCSVGA